ncbi:MAG: rhomboid family intramembrane serine protease [Planctomycetes bacterium]|nr:rhomboid family intramembrane serine protease [Planctomycetota bacterium]
MFPLRDHPPALRTPWVNYLLLAANVAVFAWMATGLRDAEAQQRFVERYGLVPATARFGLAHPQLLLETPWQWLRDVAAPFFTCMFLHGGLAHLAGNVWFLFVFGDNVEGRLGHARYLAFYLLCGLVASLLHVYMLPELAAVEGWGGIWHVEPNLALDAPMVGASGAIAGVLGAYLVHFPRARILTFVPPLFLLELPALLFLGGWFVLQFFAARVELASGGMGVGVAYWAHVGGFAMGVAIALARRVAGAERR